MEEFTKRMDNLTDHKITSWEILKNRLIIYTDNGRLDVCSTATLQVEVKHTTVLSATQEI